MVPEHTAIAREVGHWPHAGIEQERILTVFDLELQCVVRYAEALVAASNP